jgi:hypothetical protein
LILTVAFPTLKMRGVPSRHALPFLRNHHVLRQCMTPQVITERQAFVNALLARWL